MQKKKKLTKENLATLSLMMGMFFLPFGYDALFKAILDWTGSYWTTDFAFYCISGLFFMSYCYFASVNPLKALAERAQSFMQRVTGLIKNIR